MTIEKTFLIREEGHVEDVLPVAADNALNEDQTMNPSRNYFPT